MTADVSPPEPPRRRGHRTWPERLSITFTFTAAFVCLAVAAALLIGYSVVRSRNVADFQNPAEVAAAAADSPSAGPAAPTTTVRTGAAPTSSSAATSTSTTSPTANAGSGNAATEVTVDGPSTPASPPGAAATSAAASSTSTTSPSARTTVPAPVATFPAADPEALNFLITGADNGACIDPDSPMAGGFGDRESMGERSDTIMIVRVDPAANRAAVLSFPRDLWVEIADTGNMQRINSAYEPDEPQRLADTIYQNFDIPIDHYIQVDFCAFKTLVDAVGGVAVPFEFPAKDENTGLLVETTGCVNLDGDMALAYVRSRHYRYEDPPGSGNWESDPTSDLGRISRQQDFLRRVLSSLLDKGPLNPAVARGLIRAGTDYIVTDRELTPAKMMEFAGVMNDVDPGSITTYQIEATGKNINGNSVLIPNVDGENMQAVLALFQGRLSLADAPVQQFEQTTTAPPRGTTTTVVSGGGSVDGEPPSTEPAGIDTAGTEPAPSDTAGGETDETADSSAEATGSSVASGQPLENQFGIVPPRDVSC